MLTMRTNENPRRALKGDRIMKQIGIALMALTGAAAAVAPGASAQTLCGERQSFISHLGKNHHEATTAMGITSSGKVIEVLTSEKGTWTIIVTNPDGRSCLIAAGEEWESVKRIAMDPNA
jgi:hypothetical protein